MTGIFRTSLPDSDGLGVAESLALAKNLGFDAVLFTTLVDLSATLDRGELRAHRDNAAAMGMRIAAGLGGFHPMRPERCSTVMQVGNGDLLKGAARMVQAAETMGIGELFFSVGMIPDREDRNMSWDTQLRSVEDGLLQLAPVLREPGIQLLIKTHEEITTWEILRLIEALGDDVLQVAHDPVNVPCRMEDPVEATRRVAPYVRQIHIDDALLQLDGVAVRRYLAPMGKGDIDWPAILFLVPNASQWVELHRGQFVMDCFNPDWLAEQLNLTVLEYNFVVRAAVRRGGGPAPYDQVNPYPRVQPALAWLKTNGLVR